MLQQTKKRWVQTLLASTLLLSNVVTTVFAAESQLPAELNENMSTVVDMESEAIVYNGHTYEHDVTSAPMFGHMSKGNTSNNVGERVANTLTEDVTVKAGETIKIAIEGKPVYPTDSGVQIRLYTKKLDITIPLVEEQQ